MRNTDISLYRICKDIFHDSYVLNEKGDYIGISGYRCTSKETGIKHLQRHFEQVLKKTNGASASLKDINGVVFNELEASVVAAIIIEIENQAETPFMRAYDSTTKRQYGIGILMPEEILYMIERAFLTKTTIDDKYMPDDKYELWDVLLSHAPALDKIFSLTKFRKECEADELRMWAECNEMPDPPEPTPWEDFPLGYDIYQDVWGDDE